MIKHFAFCSITNTSLRFYFTQSRKGIITQNLAKLKYFYNYLNMKSVKIINELLITIPIN